RRRAARAGARPAREGRQPPARYGLAEILWDVIPFDWANDSNTAATRYMLMTYIKPGSVVLFHNTYSSTVDLVYQFIPVLKANRYRLVTGSELLGPRAPGSRYGRTGKRPRMSAASMRSPPARPRPRPMRLRPSRCRISPSPISRARIPAGRTTAP